MDTDTMTAESRLDIGGNNPPGGLELERAAVLIDEASQWSAGRAEIEDDAEASAAQTYVDRLRAAKKDLAGAQKVEAAPLEAAVAEVKAKYSNPLGSLELVLKALLDKSGVWLTKERARVAAAKAAQEAEAKRLRDEAARLERESQEAARHADAEALAIAATRAAEAAKTAKAAEKVADKKPEKVAIKGDGAVRAMTMRTYWHAEVVDEDAALKSFADNPIVRKACLGVALKLANEQARTEKREDAAPTGFRFVKDERAS